MTLNVYWRAGTASWFTAVILFFAVRLVFKILFILHYDYAYGILGLPNGQRKCCKHHNKLFLHYENAYEFLSNLIGQKKNNIHNTYKALFQ